MSQRKLGRFGRIGRTSVIAAIVVLAGTNAPASAAVPTMTLSSTTGPSGGGSTIVGTTITSAFPAGTTPTVQFQYFGTGATSCSPTARAVTQIAGSGTTTTAGVLTVDPAEARRITTTKIVVQVPSSTYPVLDGNGDPSAINPDGLVLVDSQASAKWSVCVYDSDSTTSGTLLAAASYTLAVRPTITSIFPAGSPAGGGQSITVNGTGFVAAGTAISGSIGGAALTGIQVAANGDSFTATTGPRAAANSLALTVNTAGGVVSSLNPGNDDMTNDAPIPFNYSNGITIAPNTATSGAMVNIDVNGAGFSQLTLGSGGTPTDGQAHVFLVKDAYEPDSNRGVAECGDVVVVADSELVCTLDLSADQLSPLDSSVVSGTPIADGAYMLTVVADGAADPGSDANPTIISSGAVFVVAPY